MIPVMTPARELETKVLTLAEQAKALKVTDQPSYETAVERLLGVVSLRREIVAHHEPIKKAAHETWQQAIAAEKRLLGPVVEAEQLYKVSISTFEAEQRRLEAEARDRAEEEARRQAEERREQELERAEAAGADVEEIRAMINEPLMVAPVRVEPTFQPAKGVSVAETWKGEVISLSSLVQAIAAGRADLHLVRPDDAAINEKARVTRGALVIPGVHFFSAPVVRAGRK